MKGWFLLQTKPRQEQRAIANLERQGVCTLCPYIGVEKLYRGRRVIAREVLFPGYLFINLEYTSSSITAIRSTRGVTRFVAFSGVPVEVPIHLIEQLQQTERNPVCNVIHSTLPQPGDVLKVLKGPFQGLNVIFFQPDGEQRAIVLINILGQQSKASFSYTNLCKSD